MLEFAELWSRQDVGWILAGYRSLPGEARSDRILAALERERWVARSRRGREVRFAITAAGTQVALASDPFSDWNRTWDGKWRVVSYDLPEVRRRERMLLWRELRARKLGLLQRSVWIWPHPVEEILLEVIHAEGIPECFVGLEGQRVFLCSHAELVYAAWDFEEIGRRHERYLKHLAANVKSVRAAANLRKLAGLARVERQAYREAFARDPLLPRALWPPGYRGGEVEQKHRAFCAALRSRAREWLSP